jgi:hypothetical protein
MLAQKTNVDSHNIETNVTYASLNAQATLKTNMEIIQSGRE